MVPIFRVTFCAKHVYLPERPERPRDPARLREFGSDGPLSWAVHSSQVMITAPNNGPTTRPGQEVRSKVGAPRADWATTPGIPGAKA